MARRCTDCRHFKVVNAALCYCDEGLWQKVDGSQKRVSLGYAAKSRLATQAEYCPEYMEAKRDHR